MLGKLVFKKKNLLLCAYIIYFISLPFGIVSIGVGGSLLKLIAFIPLIVWLLSKENIKINSVLIAQLLLTLYMLFTALYSINTSITISRFFSNATFTFLIIVFSSHFYSSEVDENLKKALVWASRISAILIILFGTIIEGRLILDNNIFVEDANYMNAYYSFAIINCMSLILKKNEKFYLRILSFIELLIYFYIIFSTGSRSGLFMSLGAIIVFIIMYPDIGRQNIFIIGKKILFIIIAIFFIYIIVINLVPEEMFLRFTAESIENSNGTGRYMIWENGWKIFQKSSLINQIFGYGAGTIRDIFTTNGYISKVMHNIFLEILLEDGMIGLGIYIFFISRLLRLSLKNGDLFSFSIVIGMIIFSFSASLSTFKPYWNIVLFLCFINSSSKNKYVCVNKENYLSSKL